MFESFPSTSYCSKKILSNKIEKIGWLDMQGSIRDVYIGWVAGDVLAVTIQNCGRVLMKPKNQPEGVVLAPGRLK